jgi:hypothetical protein
VADIIGCLAVGGGRSLHGSDRSPTQRFPAVVSPGETTKVVPSNRYGALDLNVQFSMVHTDGLCRNRRMPLPSEARSLP